MKLKTFLKPVVLGVALMSGYAGAANLPFVFNPAGSVPGLTPGTGDGTVGNPGGSYTGDTLNLFDNATINISTTGAVTETGIFGVSQVLLGGNPVNAGTTGIGVNYGLYGTFSATGQVVGTVNNIMLTGLTFTLFADANNNAMFAADGSSVSNTGDDFALASGSLIPGQGSAQIIGPPLNLALQALTTFVPDPAHAGTFFYSPDPFYFNLGSSFTAYGANTITSTGDCIGLTSACTIKITGGGGTAGFTPEPATLALLGLGLVGLGAMRRRKA